LNESSISNSKHEQKKLSIAEVVIPREPSIDNMR